MIWLDNHLSPALALWIAAEFGEPCIQVRDLGMARASDREFFRAASGQARILITKDRDFAELFERVGPPPAIFLLACGNTSTTFLRQLRATRLPAAMNLIRTGEPLVEIGGDA